MPGSARIGYIIYDALVPQHGNTAAIGPEVVIEPEFVLRDSTGPVRESR
jgi:hypothetical protein